jgi:hypothetical protein
MSLPVVPERKQPGRHVNATFPCPAVVRTELVPEIRQTTQYRFTERVTGCAMPASFARREPSVVRWGMKMLGGGWQIFSGSLQATRILES